MQIRELDRKVRHYIYKSFAKEGVAPTTAIIAERFNIKIASAETSLERLAREHHIALAPGSHSIWMAHPFSGLPTNYVTRINGKEYSGN